MEKNNISPAGAIKILGRSMGSKSILCVSDFHNGSIVALCSPNPVREDGLEIKPTSQQKALWEVFEKIPDKLSQKPKLFLVNGEPIDGGNRRSGGRNAWTTHYGDQINDFCECIKIIPYDNLLMTRGSPYHVDLDGTNFEEITASQLKADHYRAFGGKGRTDYQVNFEVNGKIFNATHHVGFSRWWQYRTTPLAVEMVKMHFDHDKRKFHTDVMIRSHVHYYAEARFNNTKIFSTPAWKLPDPFMYKSGLPTMPDVGMVEIIVESNGHIDIEPIIEDVNIEPMVKHY